MHYVKDVLRYHLCHDNTYHFPYIFVITKIVSLPHYRKIEEKRGVTLTADSGLPEMRTSPAGVGQPVGQINKTVSTVPSTTKRNSAWDEDWIPSRVAPSSTTASTAQPAVSSQPVGFTQQQPALGNFSSATSVGSTQQVPSSCPAVDVEWPPKSSSSAPTQFGNLEVLNGNKSPSNASLDDIDPFANWPPRPSGAPTVSSSMNNGNTPSTANKYGSTNNAATTNGLNFESTSWAFGTQNQNQNQGISSSANIASSIGGFNSQNTLGHLKQNHGISGVGTSPDKAAANLGSIFATNKNEHTGLRLAPPPTTAVGRVRGRGQGSQGQTRSNATSLSGQKKSQQPPLLDLL